MPDSPSGVYTLPPSYKVANGDLTDASQHNPPFEDVQQALTNRLHRDGRTPWTGNQNANNNRLTNLKDGEDPQDAVTVSQLNDMGVAIGDGKWSVRDLGPNWLRRNGALYLKADYPELGDILPALPDGVEWSNVNTGQSNMQVIFPMNDDRILMAREYTVGGSFQTDIFISDDGNIWSTVATLTGDVAIADFATDGNIYMAADAQGKVFTSSDGEVWSSVASAIVTSGTDPYVTSIAWGEDLFVATCGSSAGRFIYSSTDGVSWTQRHSKGSGSLIYKVRFVNGVFVAVGANGWISTSPDGINWTDRTSGASVALNDVTFGNGLYVVVGASGNILTSSNLSTWTARTSGTTEDLSSVVYSPAGFLTVGKSGVARISNADSGTSWSTVPTGTTLNLSSLIVSPDEDHVYYAIKGSSSELLKGVRTLPTQFRVPSDDPNYGWIRAK